MKEKELTETALRHIYSSAIVAFNTKAADYKQAYGSFLAKCIINSFLSYLGSKGLEVKDGKIYAKE